jgi:MraZ protein
MHERQLDDKGRLALPAPFRAHLGETCYLSFGTDQCITVVPADQFEHMATQLMARVERGEISSAQQRVVSASASLVTVDKQGRVNLDEKLRNYAGLQTEQKVLVNGNFTQVEIWAPDVFERIQQEGTSELAGAATAQPPRPQPPRPQKPRGERGSTKQTPGNRR